MEKHEIFIKSQSKCRSNFQYNLNYHFSTALATPKSSNVFYPHVCEKGL